ncbi:hypothetical protein [Spiroplasma apis]|uniref:Transmembrane protein n=1 Tax=Spiroplasma apis B31 TaxID=1276258 RepID=V5RJC4_SPIAP|nr:hypothetical protein [Spiroplasma apis]AHB36659.1 hypothetical protein SAPIS_v1c08140 [Spiroplasma apis B31]
MKNKKKPVIASLDGLCKAGAILGLVFAGIAIGSSILSLLLLSINSNIYFKFNIKPFMVAIYIFLIIIIGLQIGTIFMCLSIKNGTAKSNIAGGIYCLVLTSLIAGIFILVGKYVLKNNDNLEPAAKNMPINTDPGKDNSSEWTRNQQFGNGTQWNNPQWNNPQWNNPQPTNMEQDPIESKKEDPTSDKKSD